MKTIYKVGIGIGIAGAALYAAKKLKASKAKDEEPKREPGEDVEHDDWWMQTMRNNMREGNKMLEQHLKLDPDDCLAWTENYKTLAACNMRISILLNQYGSAYPEGFWQLLLEQMEDEKLLELQLGQGPLPSELCIRSGGRGEGSLLYYLISNQRSGQEIGANLGRFDDRPEWIEYTRRVFTLARRLFREDEEYRDAEYLELREGVPPGEPSLEGVRLSTKPDALTHVRPMRHSILEVKRYEIATLIEEELAEISKFFPAKGKAKKKHVEAYKEALWDLHDDWQQLMPEESGFAARMPRPRAGAPIFISVAMGKAPAYTVPIFTKFFAAFAYDPVGGPEEGTDIRREILVTEDPDYPRPAFDPTTLRVLMPRGRSGKSYSSLASTFFHELTHIVEVANPRINEFTKKFIEIRTEGEKPTPIADLFFINPGYGKGEMVKPDRFMDPYVGKVYANLSNQLHATGEVLECRSTEVLTVGIQMILLGGTYAAGLWNKDKEHFALTSAFIRGKMGYYAPRASP